jgi:hypothetical protein
MNEQNKGVCAMSGMLPKDADYRNVDPGKYRVSPDPQGRNPLTGSKDYSGERNVFTCVELEVFALE